MRLSCLDCGSRFRVDPRARMRTFRVACRRCGAWIVHRGSASTDAAVWQVLIAGEPVGPLRTELVIDLLERGSLGGSPLVWRHGFEQWQPMADLEPFKAPHARWVQRREATAVLSIDDLLDPNSPSSRTPIPHDAEPFATRPRASVEFVVDPLDLEEVPTPRPLERVSRLPPARDEVTGAYSLDALRQQARSSTAPPPELPAFSPAALSSIALPFEPRPVAPPPLPATPLPKPAPNVGIYVMLFVLMASVGGLVALVLLRFSLLYTVPM
jgi:hypothetical protein